MQLLALAQYKTKLWICISYMPTVFFLVPSFWGKEWDCRSYLSSWLGALLMVYTWTTHIGVLSCDANELYFCIKKIWSKNYFLFWATEWTTAGFHQKHIVARQSQTYSSWSLCELQDKLKAPGIPKVGQGHCGGIVLVWHSSIITKWVITSMV